MHWRTILRNIFSNWAGYLVTAAVGFLLSPIIVHSLGNTGYGLWTLVLSLTGYFGLLDLGIRSSVGRFVARYLALHDDVNVNRITSTAFLVLAVGGIIALSVSVIVSQFFFKSFHVEPEFESTGKLALIITGFTMACALPLGVFSSVLVSLERYDILSAVTIVGEIIRATLIVIVLKAHYGLVAVALIAMFTSLGSYLTIMAFSKRLHPPLRIGFRFVDRQTLRDLFGFGIYRFIWIVANQLIFYSDSIVIGIFLSAGTITAYAIGGSLLNYGRNIVTLVTDAFYPSAARLDARKDIPGLQNLLILGTRVALIVSLPLCLGFVFLGRQFITLWVGKEYSISALYLAVLTIPQFTGMCQNMSALVLAGMAKHRILAYVILAEGAANLVLSVILVQKIGVIGVAWGTVIPDLICTTIIIPWYTLAELRLGVYEYLTRAFVRPVIAVVPAAILAYVFSRRLEAPSWLGFGGEVALICASVAVMAYFFCLEPSHRAFAHEKVRRVFQKEPMANEA